MRILPCQPIAVKRYLPLFICLLGYVMPQTAKADVKSNKNSTSERTSGNYNSLFSFFSDTITRQGKKEKLQGWEVLFNGEDMKKWKGKDSNTFKDGWIIESGSLVLNRKGAGDIYTREQYSNFELRVEFNLTKSANSGIKYFVGELKNKSNGEITFNGPEYQIIDDYNHPEVKDHKHDVAATASCYLLYPPQNKRLMPAGEWNSVRIIAQGKHVEHWLNEVKVLEYERGSADFRQRKVTTKFKDYENYGELPAGYILLTDHGDKVYFRNIKIRRL